MAATPEHTHVLPANASPAHTTFTSCWCRPWRYLDKGVPWYQHHDAQPYRPSQWMVLDGE